MLRSKSSGSEGQPIAKANSFGMKSSIHPQPPTRNGGQKITPESRKRTLSINGENDTPSRKVPKLLVSPNHDREYVKGKGFGASIPLPLLSSISNPSSAITINFSVLAAIIVYSALQYLDQWPAILVKA